MTNQPKWKCIANLGDATPWDYGGKFVLVDQTGVYPPELEIWEVSEDEGKDRWDQYRILLERCTYENGILSDNKFHPECEAWFGRDLAQVSRCNGLNKGELIDDLCSADPLERAWAYLALVEYHGPFEFDQYPNSYTERAQVKKTMKKWLKQAEVK